MVRWWSAPSAARGSANYHGEGYFNARNNVLNANGWQQNNANTQLGPQSYYYPGGSFGGPVPGTHKHLLFWGGYEKWLQNQGNANVLTSFIPSPEMMQGDFSTDNTDNTAYLPAWILPGRTSERLRRRRLVQRSWWHGAGQWNGDRLLRRSATLRPVTTYTSGNNRIQHGRWPEISLGIVVDPGCGGFGQDLAQGEHHSERHCL